jgi:hypothetical protein
MKEAIIGIVKDLLDDRNVILYFLFILAMATPELRELVVGGVLGYWTKEKVDK